MRAIERIAGYACEVNEEQWRELVKVADEVGVPVDKNSRNGGTVNQSTGEHQWIIAKVTIGGNLFLYDYATGCNLIAYPDFLAKLKGDEKWEPKNGDEVECRDGLGADWFLAKFVGYDGKWAICRPKHRLLGHYTTHNDVNIRPLRPTITRAEAEQKLKELGVMARIVD